MNKTFFKALLCISFLVMNTLNLFGDEIYCDFTNNKIPDNWAIYNEKNKNQEINYSYYYNKCYQSKEPSLILLDTYYIATPKLTGKYELELYLFGQQASLGEVLIDYSTIGQSKDSEWENIRTIKEEIPTDIQQGKGKMTKFNVDLSKITDSSYYIRILSKGGTVIVDDIKLKANPTESFIEINSDLNKKIDSLNSGDKIKINLSLTGLFSYNGFLYAATDPGQCSFPSINKSTTKHNHDDNPLNFEQKDWIKIKINNPEQYVGKTFSRGLVATVDKKSNLSIIVEGSPKINSQSSIHNLNIYEADNFYGSETNDFKIIPQHNEIANVIGFFKSGKGYYYLYNSRSKRNVYLRDPDNLVSSDMLDTESKGEYRSALVLISETGITPDSYSLTMLKRLDNPTSANLNSIDNIIISSSNNILSIRNCQNSDISIVDLSGKIIKQTNNSDLDEIDLYLNKGFYIVIIDNKAYKIAI